MLNNEILEHMNKNELKEYFVQYGRKIKIEKELDLCSPRLSDSYVYYLDKGIVSLTAVTDEGEEKVFLYFKENRLLGFAPVLARFFGLSRHKGEAFGIDPKTDCIFYKMEEKIFNQLLRENREFMIRVMENITFNYADLVNKHYEMQGNSAGQRFCKCLLEFSIQEGDMQCVPKSFTYVEIAKYLGVHPVTVSKMAAVLREKHIIQKTVRGIEILNIKELTQMTEIPWSF